jgi:hypothetical protein
MFRTPEGSSSGRRMYIQVWYCTFDMLRSRELVGLSIDACDACIYNRLPEDEPSGFETCIIYYRYSAPGPVWERPELHQATGMVLVRCILGKFLGVVCHCFLPRLDVPTFATR